MKRQRSAWVWSVLRASLGLLLAAAALDGSGQLASADPATSPPPPPPPIEEEIADEPLEPHQFGTPYGADDAILLEDLSPDEQEGVLAANERDSSQYPPSVAAGYSAYARQAAADAEVQRAAYQAGMQGMADIGVEP